MSDIKRIAVFTSGGDAPGMNAALRAVVRTAAYYKLHVYGIKRGYQGMVNNDINRIEARDVANIIQRGGTILKTARCKEFMTPQGRAKAYESLQAHDIDACVAIGGDGTYAGANIFSEEYNIPFIGLPGTIDNDIYGTDYTIGYDTAINTAIEAVDRIRDTADSHNRLFFVEVMGRHAGFIALSTGVGGGAGAILVPETETSIDALCGLLKKGAKRKKLFSIVIVAEGNQNGGAIEIAEKVKEKFNYYDSKVSIIGHLQRGGSPTAMDRLVASRLGFKAVEKLLEGKKNVALGIVNNEVVETSFEDAITQQKPLNRDLLKMADVLAV
ncbi:MAG: 6-phosphofructokinase [Bacteroidota bacterium]